MSAASLTDQNDLQLPSSKTMKASVLCDVNRLEVRDIPRPVISPYEVLIRVTAVGLCGTDVHIFAGHANYNTNEYGQPIPLALQPQILGHEITGRGMSRTSRRFTSHNTLAFIVWLDGNCRSL